MHSAQGRPVAPVIEIVERSRQRIGDGDPIVPNDVRINGQSLLCADHPAPVVERIEAGAGSSLVLVTVTFVARRVVIDHELIDTEPAG